MSKVEKTTASASTMSTELTKVEEADVAKTTTFSNKPICHEHGTSTTITLKPMTSASIGLSIEHSDHSPSSRHNPRAHTLPGTMSAQFSGSFTIDDDDDDNIFNPRRMTTFASAFPKKAIYSMKVLEQLDTLRSDGIPHDFQDDLPPLSQQFTHDMMRRVSALPSKAEDGQLQWRNVNIFVGDKSEGKQNQILHDFTGQIKSGELLAVMGGSGAGKSTLLDALSGRSNLNQLTLEGELAINGKKFSITDQELIRSLCTFVPQSDVLCPTQTVEEALMFYANLKLASKPKEVRLKRVNYLIDVLHLKSCRHTLIGDEAKVCVHSLF